MRILLLLWLAFLSREDMYHRTLPVVGLWVGGGASLVYLAITTLSGSRSFGQSVLSLLPGLFVLLLAKITDGKVGVGDGWLVLELGLLLGMENELHMLFAAGLLAFWIACYLFMVGQRRRTIPFVPCLLVGVIVCGL